MDADTVYQMVNAELVAQGHPMILLNDAQKNLAYSKFLEYAHVTGRGLEAAVADIVRFQLQGEALEKARSQS